MGKTEHKASVFLEGVIENRQEQPLEADATTEGKHSQNGWYHNKKVLPIDSIGLHTW